MNYVKFQIPSPDSSGAEPNYARAKQTCKHFSISISTLWLWSKCRKGFPKPMKAGERVTLFDIAAIDAFLKSDGGAAK